MIRPVTTIVDHGQLSYSEMKGQSLQLTGVTTKYMLVSCHVRCKDVKGDVRGITNGEEEVTGQAVMSAELETFQQRVERLRTAGTS
jgi:hypothetical protein